MGFFHTAGASKNNKDLKGLSPDFFRKHECSVCPLNNVRGLIHPKMEPTGSDRPVILFVGSAPTEYEDRKGEQFAGKYSRIVNRYIPGGFRDSIRYTNSLNCRTASKPTDPVPLTCCFSRLVRDVEKTKPEAIFGFGHAPLFQIVNPDPKYRMMSLWRGRRVPVRVGDHVCWYYAFEHPLDIIRDEYYGKRFDRGYGSQDEFALACDLRRAFEEVSAGLPAPTIHTIEQASAGIEMLFDINTIADRLDEAAQALSAGIDIETNALRPYSEGAKILTVGVSTSAGTFVFPVDHRQARWTDLERKQLQKLIKKFLYESECRKIVHSLPFELEWFGWFYGTGFYYQSLWEDSLSAAYILDARQGGLSLDYQCFINFGLRLKDISGLDRANLDDAPLDQVLGYQGIDAKYHRLLFIILMKKMWDQGLTEVYDHQIRRIMALVQVQMHGVPVDQGVVADLKKKYKDRAAEVLKVILSDPECKKFEELKGKAFNPGSAAHVKYMMHDILGEDLESTEKGELGLVKHQLAKLIVQYRESHKVLSTYILPLDAHSEESVVFPDGMLHPIISTSRVVSWRTASQDPNSQNFPKRDDERKEVRRPVRSPDRNMRVVAFDYAGIQARNVAMESIDRKLVEAFWNDYDIHSDWRERIQRRVPKWIPKAKVRDKEALKHYRHLAKNKFVFPTFFGAQAFSMAEGLGIPKNDCEALRDEFFDEFRGIKKWHEKLDDCYYNKGYVTGKSGFICRAPISSNQRINLPIQGDEAIIVLDTLSRLAEMQDPRYIPMLEIHDDLTFLWPKNEIERRSEVVIKAMINVPFAWANVVPIEVEASMGEDWLNLKEFGKFSNNKWGGVVEIKK